jgi:hypothetical protein
MARMAAMRPAYRPAPTFAPAAWPVRVLRVLAAILLVLLAGMALRPSAHIFDMPLTEDGYYALTVARNIARGAGITIDGVNWTAGFQPLFTILQAVAFWLTGWVFPGADAPAIRLVLLLHFAVHASTAMLVALLARDSWAGEEHERRLRFWFAGALWLAAPLIFNHGYNGLETGAVLLCYAACWRWVQTGFDRSRAGLVMLGAMLGVTVLTRIDAAFLVAMLCLRELARLRRRGFAPALGRAVLLGAVAVTVSSPWWIYNWILSGSPMPSSGTAQQSWALEAERIQEALWAVGIVLVPWFFAGAHEGALSNVLRVMGLAGYGVAAALILRMRLAAPQPANDNDPHIGLRTFAFALCLAGALAMLIAYYTASFAASWFYYRYFAPLALLSGVFAPVAAIMVLRRWRAEMLAPVGAVLAAIPVAALAVLAHWGGGFSGNAVFHEQVALVRAHVPENERVAAGQSGTLGFFRARVVNLDGKVNRAALPWQGNMREYLRRERIVWFCDWPDYTERYLGAAPEAAGWRLVASRGDFRLYRYEGPG